MIVGKIVGGVIGFFSGGPVVAAIGVAAGHFFDRGLGQAMGFNYGANRERLQRLFFETTFTIMGHLAKADGRISEEEISQAEALMGRLGLNPEHRREAIDFFKRGSENDFQLQDTIANFISEGGRQQNLPLMLLEFLLAIALADGELHPAERDVLLQTANFLGINARQFDRLLSMLMAQQNFSGDQQSSFAQAPSVSELGNAYKALGVDSADADAKIKKAYRRLMSQHHPDKLIAQGVPEDMIKMATGKTQEIQLAYDLIKKARK